MHSLNSLPSRFFARALFRPWVLRVFKAALQSGIKIQNARTGRRRAADRNLMAFAVLIEQGQQLRSVQIAVGFGVKLIRRQSLYQSRREFSLGRCRLGRLPLWHGGKVADLVLIIHALEDETRVRRPNQDKIFLVVAHHFSQGDAAGMGHSIAQQPVRLLPP